MQSSYEERARAFIHQIFPFIVDRIFDIYWVQKAVADFNIKYHRNVKVCYGDARIALITSDYVIKYDYDNEIIEDIGGCEQERELYEQAVQDGFDYLFAKTTRYDYNCISFYIMPRINGVGKYGKQYRHADSFMTTEELAWCDDHKLVDLHWQNYGFRNGKVCIIDYAYIEHNNDYDDEEY